MEVIVPPRSAIASPYARGRPDKRFLERRRGAPSGAGGEGGSIWHRRGALEFRRFDEVRRDLGLELRRGDVLDNAPSKIRAAFQWDHPNGSDDMNLSDACLTLEHYVDWK